MSAVLEAYEGTDEEDARVRKLIEWNALLSELRQHPGWAVFERLVNESVGHWQVRMNSGSLDQDEYKFTAGYLKAARDLLDVHSVIEQRLARAQEESLLVDGADLPE